MDRRAENLIGARLNELYGIAAASLECLDDSNGVILVLVDIRQAFLAEYVTFHPGGIDYRAVYDHSIVGPPVN
ncbi:unannotated protein [freshwater metagenome]|uniref:Unannotated protein n=1 Tax=freshwater metagenome TaxID=449393 RepID=A0A6J6F4H5_9ZZZZ